MKQTTTERWLKHWWMFGVVCALTFNGVGSALAFELRASNDFSVTHNDVTGPGQNQSFLTEGTRYLNVLDLYGQGQLEDFRYNFNLGFKATDDPRNDSQSTSLTNLQGRITNQIHTVTLGDTYEAFSQYSLNTAIKGISYRYADNFNRIPDVSLLAGTAYSRWDNFWGVDTVERQVYGVRVRQPLTHDLWLAANLVYSDDDDKDNLGMNEYDTTTMGFDWEYLPIPGLTIRGESAWSDVDETAAGSGVKISDNGHAHKVEAIGDGGPSRVSLEYERVSPDFLTLLGSATPDREKFKARWRYRPTRTQTWTFGFLWYRDNLDGQLVERTDHYRPEIGVSLRQLFDRRYSVVNLTYKFDRAYGSRSTKDHFVTLGYRDRFAELDSDTNVGMTIYDTTDRRDELEFFANTTLSARKTVGDWILRPSLRLGAWTLENELQDTRDKTWDYSVGLGVDAPHLKVNSNIRVGYNELRRDGGGGKTEKWFANLSAYYRPDFLARFNQGMLYLRGNINDMSYDQSNRDFRENSITAGIRIQI